MNREKMREQVRKLREKRAKRPVSAPKSETPVPIPIRSIPKPQVKNGVVKTQSLTSKRTAPVQPPIVNAEVRKQHVQIMKDAQRRNKLGCGGCRRRMGG